MNQETRLEHRLAAVMATDVVGYSRSMQSDEAGTLAALGMIRKITQDQISRHRGRVANTAGDSILAEFVSAIEAVSCAMVVQEMLANQSLGRRELQVRIGIHIGDIVAKNGDLFGTAVNIATRLQGIAEVGGTVVSAAVRDDVAGKLPASFADLGMQTLKNIKEPVRAYSLSTAGNPVAPEAQRAGHAPLLPERPSIAVLPFDNMSGDPEQDYLADGMVEEIITALSRMRWLFVIARNSSFTYKGRAVDVKQVGKELGVRYVLEGSVRKAGDKVRIFGQLIDTSTGVHLWADRFDGGLDDILDLQDQVTVSVVGAIAPKLEQAEIERAKRKPTGNLDAYDYFLRGLAGIHQWTREGNDDALFNLYRAIELDPNFASAYGLAAWCYTHRKVCGWVSDRVRDTAETARLARKAAETGRDDAVALSSAGMALAYVVGDLDDGAALIDRALVLNPNLAPAWLFRGWVKVYLGEPDAAVESEVRAMRLSPLDTHVFLMQTAIAAAHFIAGRYFEASAWAETALRENPEYMSALRWLAASCAMMERHEQARKAMAHLRSLDPDLRISNLAHPFRRVDDFDRWAEGLRRAGLPE